MADFLVQHGTVGLLCALLLQWLKRAPWAKGLGDGAEFATMNRLASIVTALVAVGAFSYQGHFDQTTGQWSLTLSGSLVGVWGIVTEAAKQWVAQHGAYKGFIVVPELLGKLNAQLEREAQAQVEAHRASLPPALPQWQATGRHGGDL